MTGRITLTLLDAQKARVTLSEKELVRLIVLLTEAADATGWYGQVITISEKKGEK